MKWRARIEVDPRFWCMGVRWEFSEDQWVDERTCGDDPIWRTTVARRVDVWFHLLPLAIRIAVRWGEKLLTSEESFEKIADVTYEMNYRGIRGIRLDRNRDR